MAGRPPKSGKRSNGEGSIIERSDGTWMAAISYHDPETGKTKRHYLYGKTRPEVAEKKKAWEREFEQGILPTAKKITVSSWLDTWLEQYARVRVRQNTWEGYERTVKGHLQPGLGDILLKDLRPDQIQKFLNERLEKGNIHTGGALGARQVEFIYVVLHMSLEQAVKNRLIGRNPCDAVDRPKKHRKEFIPLTTDQTMAFLESVRKERRYPLYMVAWGAGLRRSEILGLKWEDVDLKKGTLTVRRVLIRVKGGLVFQEPKTGKSRRTVTLPEQTITALKAWKAQQAHEDIAWRGRHIDIDDPPKYNPLGLVFCDEMGQPVNPDSINRVFQKDLENARLPHVRFHDLRHGHATQLLELGMDIKVISDRLGHSTITLTADTYSHVTERLQREASDRLGQSFKHKAN